MTCKRRMYGISGRWTEFSLRQTTRLRRAKMPPCEAISESAEIENGSPPLRSYDKQLNLRS